MAKNEAYLRLYFASNTRPHVESMLDSIASTKIGAKVADAIRESIRESSKYFYCDLASNKTTLAKLARELQARAPRDAEHENAGVVAIRTRPFKRAASEIAQFIESLDSVEYPENAIVLRNQVIATKRDK
jgi:hypothetical protein